MMVRKKHEIKEFIRSSQQCNFTSSDWIVTTTIRGKKY